MTVKEKFQMVFKGGEKGHRYTEKWTPKFVEGTSLEEQEALANHFGVLHDEQAGDHFTPSPKHKTVTPKPRPVDKDKPKPPKPTQEELELKIIFAEQKNAEKKAKIQEYCLMTRSQMEKCSAEEFVDEVKEFYFKDPENPETWDKILMALCDLGIMNASPCLAVNTIIPPKSLSYILKQIFLAKHWTVMMLNCFSKFREFFDGKTWKDLRKSYLIPMCIYGLNFAPEYKTDETVTMLPKKVAYDIVARWNVLRNIEMILC